MRWNEQAMFFFALFCSEGFLKAGAQTVFCQLKGSCILQCKFKPGEKELVEWKNEDLQKIALYYHTNKEQGNSDHFKNRTSLAGRVSEGDASMLLKDVKLTDKGKYKCYTSVDGPEVEPIYVNMKVEAPPQRVNIQQVGKDIICSSEGILPRPELTWSPTNLTSAEPTITQTGEVFSISSSLAAPKVFSMDLTCIVSNGRIEKRTTLIKPASITTSSSETTISCSEHHPNPLHTHLTWSFNHNEIILSKNMSINSFTAERWRVHVGGVSTSGNLTLKELTPDLDGVYTCELSSPEETFISNTLLKVTKDDSHIGAIVGGVIGGLSILVLVGVMAWCFCQRGGDYTRTAGGQGAGGNNLQLS